MTAHWHPFREPLRTTLLRTITVSVIVGALFARAAGGGLARLPLGILLVLWPSFGGHWVELWFLNWLRPRLPVARAVQVAARLAVWYVSGTIFAGGMGLTALALGGFGAVRWPPWWVGGLVFIGIELVAHLFLLSSGSANFYDGRC